MQRLKTTSLIGLFPTTFVGYFELTFYRSLGEKYGLRIIPGKNSFLVLPNNVSRSSAVGSILAPGGPVNSPVTPRALWMSLDTDTDMETDIDFALAVSSDEKLLRRLNELDFAETVSTGEDGTDAKWKLPPQDVVETPLANDTCGII